MPTYGPIFKSLYSHLRSLSSRVSSSSSIREITGSKLIQLYPKASTPHSANVPINYPQRCREGFERPAHTPESLESLNSGNPAYYYASTQIRKGVDSECILVEQSFRMEEESQVDYMRVRRDIEAHGIRQLR